MTVILLPVKGEIGDVRNDCENLIRASNAKIAEDMFAKFDE